MMEQPVGGHAVKYKMTPSAHFSLNEKLAKAIEGKEIGERYTVMVVGKITNLSKSDNYNSMSLDIDKIHCDGGLKEDVRRMKKDAKRRAGYSEEADEE